MSSMPFARVPIVAVFAVGILLAGCNCGDPAPVKNDAGTRADAGTGADAGAVDAGNDDAGFDGGIAALSISDVTVAEGDTGSSQAIFTVELSAASTEEVTVDFSTADDSATAAPDGGSGDYESSSGTLTFAPGTTSQTVEVTVHADVLDEVDERFEVRLSNAFGAQLPATTDKAYGHITDDDAPPELAVSAASVTEGDSGSTQLVFPVTLSEVSGRDVSVKYTTTDGTAVAGQDYDGNSGELTIPAGATTASLAVTIAGDTIDEPDETLTVTLSEPDGATLGNATAVGTVTDDDDPPALSIADATVSEGNSGTKTLSFVVSLSSASSFSVSAGYSTVDGTAVTSGGANAGGEDFAAAAGTVTFAPGSTSETVSVTLNGDVLNEPNETFMVELSNPTQATIADAQAIGTIENDDAEPTLFISDITFGEGTGTTATSATFTVQLSAASGQTVSVEYATANGSAVQGSDYAATSGTLTFAPGILSQTAVVPVNPDAVDENDETFQVALSNPVAATLATASATATIIDDDPAPGVSVADVTVVEGNTSSSMASFVVTLSGPSQKAITFDFSTSDGTAVAGADYTAAMGTVTLNPGDVTATINVVVLGDTSPEGDETFTLVLSNPSNVTLVDAVAVGTLLEDDAPVPAISVSDPVLAEGNSGTTTLTFAVTLSTSTTQTVTVAYSTADGTATSGGTSALGGEDYVATSGTLTFAPGTTQQLVSVQVNADTLHEPSETVNLVLSGATNATIGDPTGVGTLTNDDAAPVITIGDITSPEGSAGTRTLDFEVKLSAASQLATTIDFTTTDGTATASGAASVGGSDYVATSGTVSIPGGATSALISVTVNGDTVDELDETFTVDLNNPTTSVLGDAQGVGTIQNDDIDPSISIDSVSVTEGNSGTVDAVFTVSLSAPSALTVTVDHATADLTATSPLDYTSTSGTVTFVPGATSMTITVPVSGDVVDEANEKFAVDLSGATNATVAVTRGTGTIINDDSPLPGISINDVAVTEGNSGSKVMTFTVALSQTTTATVTVDFTTMDGTAEAGSDYVARTGTVTFAPGTLMQPVEITINADTLDEANETFLVLLSNAVNGSITDGEGQGTISDDDASPSLSIDDVTISEGNTGTTTATFTVTLSAASGRTVTVNHATVDGTATAGGSASTGGEDYEPTSGTLTFAPGDTTRTITVDVNGDALDETNETFRVDLSGATNATMMDSTGAATLNNDDAAPVISIADHTSPEGGVGSVTPFTFLVTLSAPSGRPITVNYATANGTAASGTDYLTTSGTLTLNPGATGSAIIVQVGGDAVIEPNETFLVNLTNEVNVTMGDPQAIGTIVNDD